MQKQLALGDANVLCDAGQVLVQWQQNQRSDLFGSTANTLCYYMKIVHIFKQNIVFLFIYKDGF